MMYLFDHYGEAFMSALHREDLSGLAGLDKVLDQFGSKKSGMDTIHDWAATMALDAQIDKGRKLTGGRVSDFTAKSLSSSINWGNTQAYDSPGAPPNGSDYVRLRDAAGKPLSAKALKSITFKGATSLEPEAVEWASDPTPPNGTTADMSCGNAIPDGSGPQALYSGCGSNLDRSIVRSVSVPAGGGQLSFDTLYDTEEGWDFGFVQVSTDGGKTYQSLATEDTTSEHDPDAVAGAVENLPGLTGDSGTWKTEHADLTPYAGKTILLGFRYITDGGVDEGGYWVRNIDAAGTTLPTTLDGWQTISQANPTPVSGYTVQLIGYDAKGKSWIYRMPLTSSFSRHAHGRPPRHGARQERHHGGGTGHAGRPDGGRDAVRALHALGQRCDPAGRLTDGGCSAVSDGGRAATTARRRAGPRARSRSPARSRTRRSGRGRHRDPAGSRRPP